MSKAMHHPARSAISRTALPCLLCPLWLLLGCAERRIVITSEPPQALVTLNDVQVGLTPLEVDFTYFGTYDVRLTKPGYEPLITKAEAEAPFHEWPVVDLVAAVVPVQKKTRIDWHFTLEPDTVTGPELVQRGAELRQQLELVAPPESSSGAP